MESQLNKPVYNYNITTNSKVYFEGRSNCCFISSFQIQMKKIFNDFPDLNTILNLLYPVQSNAFTHFAYDFPAKWYKLKSYLISQDKKWESRLSKVMLQICLPLTIKNQCVLLSYIDLNIINPDEVNTGNYDSLEKSFSDQALPNYHIISIIQQVNHFEPIDIINECGHLNNVNLIKNPDFLI